MGRFAPKDGSLVIPRVKIEYAEALEKVLPGLGMGIAFQPRADFGNLFERNAEPIYIGAVTHKTFLEINETGTEAAAATAVIMLTGAAPSRQDRFDMMVDRPYLVAIRDDQTGMLLFLGAILDPQ